MMAEAGAALHTREVFSFGVVGYLKNAIIMEIIPFQKLTHASHSLHSEHS
jgi:hypothetical protein